MKNISIRECARKNGVKFWEIAEALGVSEATVTRRMRQELSQEEKEKILAIIDNLAKEAV